MRDVDRRGNKERSNLNLLDERQNLVVLAEKNRQESFFKVNRVNDYIIETI